jgi:hypothetical protein
MARRTKKQTSKSSSSDKKMAWCVSCKKKMPMVESKEVSMKMRGGKTRKRLAGKDEHGHKVSLFL